LQKRVHEICRGIIERGLDVTWICSARIGSLDLETMKLMKQAGCHMLRLGVESGNQRVLDTVKKGITLEQTVQCFEWIHRAGLDSHAHCMLGIPGETAESIEDNIRFVKRIDPTIVTFGICTPYPGTPLFSEVQDKHPEIEDGSGCDLSQLHTNAFFNQYFTGLTPEFLQKAMRRAYRMFYLRPGYILRWLGRIRNIDEFRRVTLAATEIFQFIGGRD